MFFFFEDNSVPGFEQMMIPVLASLQQLGGTANLRELDAKAIEVMGLPESISQIPHKDSAKRTEVSYRLAWARTYLKKSGIIKNTTRGVWSLVDKSIDITQISPDEILKTVREKQPDGDTSSLSSFESRLAFENFVLSLLQERAKKQDKPIKLFQMTQDFGFDAYLPDGIDEIVGPVYCEIKYFGDNQINFLKQIRNYLHHAINSINSLEIGTILFITNQLVSAEMRGQAQAHVPEGFIAPVVIWDRRELSVKVNPESAYANYLIAPKQALVEATLLSDLTAEEKSNRREGYIQNLITAYRKQDISLILGAGVSFDSGIPLWTDLIKQLLIQMINSKAKGKKLNQKQQELLHEIAYNNKENSPITQMRYIRSAFSDEEYYSHVHKVLYSGKLVVKSKLLNAIANISSPHWSYNGIKGIITYNFDDLLERNFDKNKVEYKTIYCDSDMASHERLNIYHVHGYLPLDLNSIDSKPELVFSEEDYHKVYQNIYSWSNLMQLNAFRDSTCLFVGCSLTDPNLRRLLDSASRDNESPRHYAILKRNKFSGESTGKSKADNEIIELYQGIDDNIREGYYKKLGINIIWFDEYHEVPDILLRLL